ncbi:hypothetical protein HHK36_008677 [Tetracentron sinense]|uniref:J domain-containing protein n=1 Tax=Tetracentron sinense TaxID=13715 RepID=A0A834ZFV9_TETSI|nr:hypothetical protein HHK36_008677 [Tetracentron sinense]
MLAASSPSFLRSGPHFFGPKIALKTPSPAPESVKYRPPRCTATYTTTERTRPPSLCSPKIASSASLYQVLGIPMSATCQEIKAAYRRLARVCHPDVATIDRKDSSADEFKKIHAAYSTLIDPEKRADYDRKLFRPKRPYCSSSSTVNSSSMAGFSGHSRRTWETDQCW